SRSERIEHPGVALRDTVKSLQEAEYVQRLPVGSVRSQPRLEPCALQELAEREHELPLEMHRERVLDEDDALRSIGCGDGRQGLRSRFAYTASGERSRHAASSDTWQRHETELFEERLAQRTPHQRVVRTRNTRKPRKD